MKDASGRILSQGMTAPRVRPLCGMRARPDGGFYKHFGSKDDLLMESLSQAFEEIGDRLVQAAEQSEPGRHGRRW